MQTKTSSDGLTFREGMALAAELTQAAPSGVTVSLVYFDGAPQAARIHFEGPTGHHSVSVGNSSRERVLAHADGFFELTRRRAARLLGAELAEVA